MRDSKDVEGIKGGSFPMIELSPEAWSVFLAEVIGDAAAGSNGEIFTETKTDGSVIVTTAASDVALTYDNDEWIAFKGGVVDGDFGPIAVSA